MRHKSSAQSLVEMALILPLMLFIFFAIIDMGWYIYGYGTIYNAARRGAEEASQLPPWPSSIVRSDPMKDGCFGAVYRAVEENAVMFPTLTNFMSINYIYPDPDKPSDPPEVLPNNNALNVKARQLGGIIQVSINGYELHPLTPLLTLGKAFGFGGVDVDGNAIIKVSTSTRRTIESMGFSPGNTDGCRQ